MWICYFKLQFDYLLVLIRRCISSCAICLDVQQQNSCWCSFSNSSLGTLHSASASTTRSDTTLWICVLKCDFASLPLLCEVNSVKSLFRKLCKSQNWNCFCMNKTSTVLINFIHRSFPNMKHVVWPKYYSVSWGDNADIHTRIASTQVKLIHFEHQLRVTTRYPKN